MMISTTMTSLSKVYLYVCVYSNTFFSFTEPSPVDDIRVEDVSTTVVNISWKSPDAAASTYSYRILFGEKSDKISPTTSTEISELNPGTTYQFSIYSIAADNKTEGIPKEIDHCTSKSLEMYILKMCKLLLAQNKHFVHGGKSLCWVHLKTGLKVLFILFSVTKATLDGEEFKNLGTVIKNSNTQQRVKKMATGLIITHSLT